MGLCTWRSMVGSAFGSIYVVFFLICLARERAYSKKGSLVRTFAKSGFAIRKLGRVLAKV